jgi:hypothetical protein
MTNFVGKIRPLIVLLLITGFITHGPLNNNFKTHCKYLIYEVQLEILMQWYQVIILKRQFQFV